MVDFMCQLDWVTACPDIWSNILLTVSSGAFLDEITVLISRVKQISPQVSGFHPIS